MLKLILPILSAFLLLSTPLLHETPKFHHDTVNALLGDISYTNSFGVEPDITTSEEVRIKTHLEYVIKLLKEKDSSDLNSSQVENRLKLIALLKDYVEAGTFPKNRHFNTRNPVFIDEDGNLCAVGYLIAQTEGLETAEEINQHHKFDFIKDIDPKYIDGWLASNGITKNEAAMIQPMYGGVYTETIEQNEIELEYAIGSSLLAGMQLGTTAYSILSDNSPSTVKKVSAFNSLLGMGSITLGLLNLDNTYTDIRNPTTDPQLCAICYSRYETTYKNPTRTKFSIANIVVGGLSAAFNGYRFFQANEREKPSNINISATQLYDPTTQTFNPGLSFSMKF